MGEHDGHRERLKRRFLEHGMDTLQDHEALELLLFYAVPRKDTNPIARALLKHFGSISAVLEASAQELKQVAGIGEHAAMLLHLITPMARRYQLSRTDKGIVFETIKDCGEFLVPYFFGIQEEQIYLLCLDAKKKFLACRLLQEGSANAAYLPIRKAAEIAMSCNASSVILAHNHPGGLALPSTEDYAATLQLRETFEPLGIVVVDHIVVSDNEYISLKDSGYY